MFTINLNESHGGILFPLEPFRPKLLAAALGEGLVAKARNITDAKLSLTRHPQAGLVLAKITGSIVEDEGEFWRENADLAMYASQALPRQCFLYFVIPEPERREGFMVAQRGQVVAADEGTADNMPADAGPEDWPVARLAEQIRVSLGELQNGFQGGPSIEVSLLEPEGDERELLLALAGQPPDAAEGAVGQPDPEPAEGEEPGPDAPPKKTTVEQDQKRRAAQQQAEQQEREALAAKVRSDLPYAVDDLGVIVAPAAELSDADVLTPYVVRALEGDPPAGIPREMTEELQGRRIDFAVKVEFLSEVFTEDGPLTKAVFTQAATQRELGGKSVLVMEVLAPRLSPGTLLRSGTSGVFISRRPEDPQPEAFLTRLLDAD
jgi:hypothetical protein